MNEGENSSMSNNPNFSSPNISSGNEPTPIEPAATTQQAITSTDIASMANTDAGAVAAAAAAMPENDSLGAISSAPTAVSTRTAQSRLGFRSRRFNASTSQQTNAFAATPDYLNQAINDSYANDAKPKSKIKFIIIGALAAVIVIVLCVIALTSVNNGKLVTEGKEIASKMDDEAIEDILYLEDAFTRISSVSKEGRENIMNMFREETYASYTDKIEKVAKMSASLNELNADKYSNEYKEILKTAQNKLSEASEKYNDYLNHYKNNYEYIVKGKASSGTDSSIPELAKQYTAYINAKQAIKDNNCMAQVTFTTLCRSLIDQRKSADKYMNEAEIADVFGGRSKVTAFVKVHAELSTLRELIVKHGGDAK